MNAQEADNMFSSEIMNIAYFSSFYFFFHN